jgi:hypothetical protein
MTAVRVDAGLGAPWLDAGSDLRSLLEAAAARRTFPTGQDHVPPGELWSPAHFGLDRVTCFCEASPEAQARILTHCARWRLAEAYFIEQLGLAFTAKMVLLSETADERILYSLFAADEATHFHAIASYLADCTDLDPDQPFLRLLATAVEDGDKACLTYLIQVVLEGWGISHYRSIARGCRSEHLGQVLSRIARDEALHHRSGVILARRHGVEGETQAFLVEVLVRLFQMVQAGPQGVVGGLETVLGPLSSVTRVRAFRELNAPEETRQRLDLLGSLMRENVAAGVMAMLERYGVLKPSSPEECAAWTAPR